MKYFILAFVCIICKFCSSEKLPRSFKTCKRSQTDYTKCLGSAIEDALKKLKTPIPEIGLPSLDPLVVTDLQLAIHHKNINLDESIHKLTVTGLSDAKVSHTTIDFENKTFHFNAMVPKTTVIVDHEIAGTLLETLRKLNVTVTSVIENSIFTIIVKFKEIEKEGSKYMKIIDFDTKFEGKMTGFTIKSNDKTQSEELSKVLEDYAQQILSEVGKDWDKLLGNIFMHLANELFSKVPSTDIFLK